MAEPLTSVLLPCWNALDMTRVCLGSLERWTSGRYELVVVLNGCRDGSREWLARWSKKARGPERVVVLSNRQNLGYPAGMNQALAAARGELVVFANNDAAPGPGWLGEMAGLFARRPRLGGLAPSHNPPEARPLSAAWSAPPWYGRLQDMPAFAAACALRLPGAGFVRASGFLPGFWFMTTRAVLSRVGAFDERFAPGGFEDWDLQARIRSAGFELGFAARAYVHHVWFGAYRANGRTGEEAYPANRERLRAKHPRLRRWTLDLLTPLTGAAGRAAGATRGSARRRPRTAAGR